MPLIALIVVIILAVWLLPVVTGLIGLIVKIGLFLLLVAGLWWVYNQYLRGGASQD